MRLRPTPETDALHEQRGEIHSAYFMMVSNCRRLERERDEARDRADTMFANHVDILDQARRERDEAREYADKLVAHKDMVCLPKDLEVLREANLGLAVELNEAQNEILGWKNKWDCAIEMGARAENALDEAREAYVVAIDQLVVAQSETRKERALADRLAKGIELFLSQTISPLAPLKVPLDAWKEARK